MALSRQDTERALGSKLGLQMDPRDHRVYRLYVGGRFVVRTMVSTGSRHRTLGDPLVAVMAKQLRVTPADLRAIVACTLDRDDYLQRLRAAGVIPSEEEPSSR